MEKRATKGFYCREREASPEVKESVLMGGSRHLNPNDDVDAVYLHSNFRVLAPSSSVSSLLHHQHQHHDVDAVYLHSNFRVLAPSREVQFASKPEKEYFAKQKSEKRKATNLCTKIAKAGGQRISWGLMCGSVLG